MLVEDADADVLKKWIVKRLEDISDADSDVLADYVLALIRSDDPDDTVRRNCVDNLKDFLRQDSEKFVDEVINAVRTKSYLPGHAQISTLIPTAPAFNPPAAPSALLKPSSANGSVQSKKRSFGEHQLGDVPNGPSSSSHTAERFAKQMRRGAKSNGTGAFRGTATPTAPSAASVGQGNVPPRPPAGFPQFDLTNPMSAVLALQAMSALAGLPPLPIPGAAPASPGFGQGPQGGRDPPPRVKGKRCYDYDTKGFCALGSTCPYDHGTDSIIVPGVTPAPDPYMPGYPLPSPMEGIMSLANPNHRAYSPGRVSTQGRRSSHSNRVGRSRFSSLGRNFDRKITTVVVENIPEEYFSEAEVRKFFREFGSIKEIDMQPYKHLALVKYEDYDSALRAYESPKTIFENRFVKVYWFRPDRSTSKDGAGGSRSRSPNTSRKQQQPEESQYDPVEVERKLAEAQKSHEEKLKKQQHAKEMREALEQKMKDFSAKRRKLLDNIESKEKKTANGAEAEPQKGSEQSELLRAKIALLEAEAESLGLDPDDPYSSMSGFGYPRGRGRGGYYGSRGYMPRGRGSYRGYRGGRGSYRGVKSSVMRLDNRPKMVVVYGISQGSPKDEELRQYLFNNFEDASIDSHPDKPDAQIVTFKERYLAESFITNTGPLGKLDLAWYTDPAGDKPASSPPPDPNNRVPESNDVAMEDAQPTQGKAASATTDTAAAGGQDRSSAPQDENVDLDVADDDAERWMR